MLFYSLILLAILIIFTIIILYFISIYNRLIGLKHSVNKAWANIDVLLKQRHDELPKLVDVCKQYMQYEVAALEKIVQARTAIATASGNQDMQALGEAESGLRSGLGQLFALAENYPDLKANGSFQHLQHRISLLENSISDRRELYNDAVNQNNICIDEFPNVLIANTYGFKPTEMLQFSEGEREDVNIKSLFNN